ncbi:MAG: oligosaccharide flippase family protein [bacterium]
MVGKVIATSTLGGQIWRDDRSIFKKSIRWGEMLKGMVRHRKFPMINLWALLLSNLSGQIPIFLLTYFFNSIIVGYYAFGYRMIQIPMSLIGNSIGQVFFQRASVLKKNGKLPKILEITIAQLIKIGLFPIFIICFFCEDIFFIVFGPDWHEAGIYARILLGVGFIQFVYSPISTIFSVHEKQQYGLLVNLLTFISRLFSFLIGGLINNIYLTLILYSVTGVIAYLFAIFLALKLTKVKVNPSIIIILKHLLLCILILPFLFLIKKIQINIYLNLLIAFLLIAGYFAVNYKTFKVV